MYNNTSYSAEGIKKVDDLEFINLIAERYESRRHENISSRGIIRQLNCLEDKYKELEIVKRVRAEIDDCCNRFFLYDMTHDLMKGNETGLNSTICDMWDGAMRYQIAKETGRSIVHVDISEAKSAWFGESEKRIKKIFTSYKNACEITEKKG